MVRVYELHLGVFVGLAADYYALLGFRRKIFGLRFGVFAFCLAFFENQGKKQKHSDFLGKALADLFKIPY